MAENIIGTSGSSGSSGLYMDSGITTNIIIKKYIIFDYSEIHKINFNEVYETSQDTLRKSIDGMKTFIKYDDTIPNSIQLIENKSQEYTYQEIITILSTNEWTKPITI